MSNEGAAFSHNDQGSILSRKDDFENTPISLKDYWQQELGAAFTRQRKWMETGQRVNNMYLGKLANASDTDTLNHSQLNLFHANVSLVQAMLFGNLPTVDVDRKFADPADDIARVAALIADRLMNIDIRQNAGAYEAVLKAILQDRLIPGLGCARVRYESNLAEGEETSLSERAEIDYVHWQDVRWGWTRTFNECPWIAFRSMLKKDAIAKRFGQKIADELVYQTVVKKADDNSEQDETSTNSNWLKAEVWEIWDKQTNEVLWYSAGAAGILEQAPDPLQLEDFFPCPPFLMANPTTTLMIPTSDFKIAEDLYIQIDILQTRITIITEAVRVVGVYNADNEELKRLFTESAENDMIPVQDWSMFGESGGLQGNISWFPVQDVVTTLRELITIRDQTIELLYQITGMSDILRGGGTKERESATAQNLKAKFGSARLQGIQDAFANYVGQLMSLKLEIITKHFSPETIAIQANVTSLSATDFEHMPAAIELLQDPQQANMRLSVEADSFAMVDFAQRKQERVEFMSMFTNMLKSLPAFLELVPGSLPFALEMVQWTMASFKGSAQVEGVLDKAIEQAIKEPPKQKEDGKAAAEQAKIQGQMQVTQQKFQQDMQRDQNKHQSTLQLEQIRSQNKMQEMYAQLQSSITKIQEKMNADVQEEQLQSSINAEQHAIAIRNEADRDTLGHALGMEHDTITHENSIEQEMLRHKNKMAEIMADAETTVITQDAQDQGVLAVNQEKAETEMVKTQMQWDYDDEKEREEGYTDDQT